MATCEIQVRCLGRGSSHSPIVLFLWGVLLSTEAQPDEIERPAHAYQEANEGEVLGVEEVVCRPADPAPEEQARDEIAEDRPERILFATVSWFLGHWAMVDEFSTSDN